MKKGLFQMIEESYDKLKAELRLPPSNSKIGITTATSMRAPYKEMSSTEIETVIRQIISGTRFGIQLKTDAIQKVGILQAIHFSGFARAATFDLLTIMTILDNEEWATNYRAFHFEAGPEWRSEWFISELASSLHSVHILSN